eukprot:TRINITY_DN16203_c0_g1_i1.p1 TRINITY_DN16203_c0_g1~~TRINITY_DN16203_c0_g1_i1.p1  ORF type:complete len:565 (-),score=124.23 TRINITY_DN16203_c0_g1_i1:38-1732(-)
MSERSGGDGMLSCYGCRMKKVGCDRRVPCLNCIKAGVDCVYLEKKKRTKRNQNQYNKWINVINFKEANSKKVVCFGVSSHHFLKKTLIQNFHPFTARAVLQEEALFVDIWTSVMTSNPLPLRSWGTLNKCFRIAIVIATTLYLIHEPEKAILFDRLVYRIVDILLKNPIPADLKGALVCSLLLLVTEGHVGFESRQELLQYIAKEKLVGQLTEGIRRDKASLYGFHFLAAFIHFKDTHYHIHHMQQLEASLEMESILFIKFLMIDCWSFMFIHHGVDFMRYLMITPELFHRSLLEYQYYVELFSSSYSTDFEEWKCWYQALLETKWAIYYTFIVENPSQAMASITKIKNMKLQSYGKYLISQFPILVYICSKYKYHNLCLEFKRDFELYPYSKETFYLKQKQIPSLYFNERNAEGQEGAAVEPSYFHVWKNQLDPLVVFLKNKENFNTWRMPDKLELNERILAQQINAVDNESKSGEGTAGSERGGCNGNSAVHGQDGRTQECCQKAMAFSPLSEPIPSLESMLVSCEWVGHSILPPISSETPFFSLLDTIQPTHHPNISSPFK